MDIGVISTRYAKSLLKFSKENKEEQKVYEEMQMLSQNFQCVPHLQKTLKNPVCSAQQKIDLLICATCGNQKASRSIKRFYELLLERQRADYMIFIANSYISQYRADKNIIKSKLTVPISISDSLRQKLQQFVEQKNNCQVDLEIQVDKEILGGFILEHNSYQLDASLRTQLTKLHRTIKN